MLNDSADDLPQSQLPGLDDLFGRVAGRFGRVESRRQARLYLLGLLTQMERKNGWQLADAAGDATPDRMQRLLNEDRWDARAVRQDLCSYVTEQFGDPGGILIADETRFVKKGLRSAGVHRQYSAVTGLTENCQVGVFLAYAAPRGAALVDAELYLPRSWTDDRARRAAAGIPDHLTFATKPSLAVSMLRRALDASMPAQWISACWACGQDQEFRIFCEQRRLGYVIAIPYGQPVETGPGSSFRAGTLAASASPGSWQRPLAEEEIEWTLMPLPGKPSQVYRRWLLARRNITDPGEMACYMCSGPDATTIACLVRVARALGRMRECLASARKETGLDQYQVRRYDGWHRHVTLAMLAASYLAARRRPEITFHSQLG